MLNLRKPSFLILLTSVFIVFLSLVIYFSEFYTDIKYISVTNFYNTELDVYLNSDKVRMLPYEIKYFESKDIKNLHVTAYDDTGLEYFNKEIVSDTPRTEVILVTLSNFDYCYYTTNFTTDIDSLNYTELISNLEKYIRVDFSKFSNLDVYIPGKDVTNIYDIAILPILCSKKDNDKDILNNNKIFRTYDDELQREYYLQNVDKINNTESVDELNLIDGYYKNDYNVFNFGNNYLFTAE